jgi:hypothetical protein
MVRIKANGKVGFWPWLFHALKDSVRHMQLVSSTASR